MLLLHTVIEMSHSPKAQRCACKALHMAKTVESRLNDWIVLRIVWQLRQWLVTAWRHGASYRLLSRGLGHCAHRHYRLSPA